MLGVYFDHQGTCWVLGAGMGGRSHKDWDRLLKQALFQEKNEKNQQLNPHGAQIAYQLTESTARDELVRLWQRTVFILSLFIGRIRQ